MLKSIVKIVFITQCGFTHKVYFEYILLYFWINWDIIFLILSWITNCFKHEIYFGIIIYVIFVIDNQYFKRRIKWSANYRHIDAKKSRANKNIHCCSLCEITWNGWSESGQYISLAHFLLFLKSFISNSNYLLSVISTKIIF